MPSIYKLLGVAAGVFAIIALVVSNGDKATILLAVGLLCAGIGLVVYPN